MHPYGESTRRFVDFRFQKKSPSIGLPPVPVATTSTNRTVPRSLSLLPSSRTQATRSVKDVIFGKVEVLVPFGGAGSAPANEASTPAAAHAATR